MAPYDTASLSCFHGIVFALSREARGVFFVLCEHGLNGCNGLFLCFL